MTKAAEEDEKEEEEDESMTHAMRIFEEIYSSVVNKVIGPAPLARV